MIGSIEIVCYMVSSNFSKISTKSWDNLRKLLPSTELLRNIISHYVEYQHLSKIVHHLITLLLTISDNQTIKYFSTN